MAEAPGGGKRVRPGGHELRPEVVRHHVRQRILAGAARAFTAQGYRQVSVADIVRSAAIARTRFYENFASKQDCFFALYDEATEAALAVVAEACQAGERGFPERVQIGLAALVAHLEADRTLARACVVEGPAVGPPISERFERMISSFAELLRAGRDLEAGIELPDTVEETVVGGLYWLIYYALLDTDPEQGLEALLPQCTEFSLIPFIGAEAARAAASP
jgi:AcrR family transcriptional regulator